MLSRRGIRIKAMKRLYALSRDESLTMRSAINAYQKSIADTYDLYLFCVYSLAKICRMSTDDEEKRKAKYLPTEEDKIFTSKLYNNPIIQSIDLSKELSNRADKGYYSNVATKDFASKIYSDFCKEEAYQSYLAKDSTDQDHLDILLELFRFCRKNEYFNDVMEDHSINWIDDKSLVIGTVKKTLKALPSEESVFQKHLPDDEIVTDFGELLLKMTYEDDDELLEIVKPVLDNWDHERLAVIDMILIKMALIEFTNFETIPVKVTLNEYVEISKIYSTPKSKEFVNGILDKLLKQLQSENKIEKEGRGLDS